MVFRALFFICLHDGCLYDDDLPIANFELESPGGTPYLLPALRALGPSGHMAFWRLLGSPWTLLGSPWTPFWSTWGHLGRFFVILRSPWTPFFDFGADFGDIFSYFLHVFYTTCLKLDFS